MSGDRIEAVIAEGVDRIALPPESEWIPDLSRASRRRFRPSFVFVPLATAAVIVLAAVIGSGLRTVREVPATQPPKSQAPLVVPPASPSPEATPRPADPSWQQLRQAGSMPAGMPIIEPTWLPPVFDGVGSQMSGSTSSRPADTMYLVSYTAGRDRVAFTLRGSGVPSPSPAVGNQSGLGALVVRRSPAVLTFPSDLFSAPPGSQGLRVVSWTEGPYALRIESETVSGDDLLRIAWSLDQTGAPGPAPAARAKPGVCADAVSPDATAHRLIGLIGSQDRDALTDCFASEGAGFAGPWSSLPSASLDSIRSIEGAGGRIQLQVSWTFASAPGGAWNLRPTNFFLIGREDGVWRVFAVNTAPFPKSP
jgi:hypothetical protein